MSEADYEAQIAPDEDNSLAEMAESIGSDVFDLSDPLASDPQASADAESDVSTDQVSQNKAAAKPATTTDDDGEVDFTAMRLNRDAKDAALALVDAGIPEATVKTLFKNDKAGLVEFAKRLAGQNQAANASTDAKGASQQAQAAESDPFAAIFDEAAKGLTDHMDEEGIPKFLEPMKKATATLRETFNAEIKKVRDEYSLAMTQLQNHTARVEADAARRALMSEWPQLKDQTNFQKAIERIYANRQANPSKQWGSIEEMLSAASNDLWGGDRAAMNRTRQLQNAKDRAIGQPTVKDGRTDGTGSVKEVSLDQWEEAIYTARANANRRGDDPDKAVAAVKARLKIKPGSRY